MNKEKSEITLKISAIIIALILWGFVMSKENPEGKWIEKDIEVIFTNMESVSKSGLVIMSPNEATVSVEVSGRKLDRIKNFSSEDIKAEVDLSGYSEGQRKVPIKVTLESSSMKITGWEPREILFDFDKIISEDKAVTIRTEGELAPGYVLGNISTKSEFVLLKGPRSWVNEVSEIIASIKLTDRKEDINATVPIKLIDDKGEIVTGIKSEPSIIDVFIPVYRTTTVPIEINTIGELPESYEIGNIEIRPKTITLKGKDGIENLKFVQTKQIDINSFMENENIIIELDLPKDVSLLNPDEKITVSLKIEEAFTRNFQYSLAEIEARNLNPEFKIDLEETSELIEITLKGDQETIESLSKEDIEVYIDLNTLEEGEHIVFIGIDTPLNVNASNVAPQPIKLNLIIDN